MSHFERESRIDLGVYRQDHYVEILAENVGLATLHCEIVDNAVAMEILKFLKQRLVYM